MDYYSLGSLSNLLQTTQQTLNEDQIAVVCQQTLKGLVYLHNIPIIHRDVKPANIMMDHQGILHIGDFGVSCYTKKKGEDVSDLIGTPSYMSPEVVQKKNYNGKADIWSLGITVIELAEGVPPHYKMPRKRAMMMIPIRAAPTFKEPTKWSANMQDFLSHCLVKDPTQRSSAIDLLLHPFVMTAKGPQVLKELIEKFIRIKEARAVQRANSKDTLLQPGEFPPPQFGAGGGAQGDDQNVSTAVAVPIIASSSQNRTTVVADGTGEGSGTTGPSGTVESKFTEKDDKSPLKRVIELSPSKERRGYFAADQQQQQILSKIQALETSVAELKLDLISTKQQLSEQFQLELRNFESSIVRHLTQVLQQHLQ